MCEEDVVALACHLAKPNPGEALPEFGLVRQGVRMKLDDERVDPGKSLSWPFTADLDLGAFDVDLRDDSGRVRVPCATNDLVNAGNAHFDLTVFREGVRPGLGFP